LAFTAKNFENLIGTQGLSETLLRNHFKLYEGYVNNTNALTEKLNAIAKDSPEFAELKRRFGWEFNGMRLHELYFGNISKGQVAISAALKERIAKQFGSWEAFEADFKATGKMRGIGWVLTVQDNNGLYNIWVNEHDVGHLAGTKIILVMDVFEHAYMTDYGIKKAGYIEVFFKAVNWKFVEDRLNK